ncbi:putative periplasmic binding protein-like I [Helianthus annuus]|nr:putative periplasmic binding protein-like I [Helianthus annuus]
MSGIRLYDTVFGLAMALEKIQKEKGDSDGTGALNMRTRLLSSIRNFRFDGLSGNFNVINGQLQSSVYEIVNIIGSGENTIGFWSPEIDGISKKLSNNTKGLKPVTWPGGSHVIPKGWEIPVSNKNMLRVAVRVGGLDQFIDADIDSDTGQVSMTGFCVDVFNAVVNALPYALKIEFVPFVTSDGKKPAGSYDDLVFNLSIGGYDAIVGDITILADRLDRVAFTLPYTEAGVSLVVPIRDERKSAWIFLKPLEKELWLTIGAFFIYIGLVVWVIEHRVNGEFRGPPHKQLGMLLWFSFSTLVYAHSKCLFTLHGLYFVLKRNRAWERNFSFCWDIENVCLTSSLFIPNQLIAKSKIIFGAFVFTTHRGGCYAQERFLQEKSKSFIFFKFKKEI